MSNCKRTILHKFSKINKIPSYSRFIDLKSKPNSRINTPIGQMAIKVMTIHILNSQVLFKMTRLITVSQLVLIQLQADSIIQTNITDFCQITTTLI